MLTILCVKETQKSFLGNVSISKFVAECICFYPWQLFYLRTNDFDNITIHTIWPGDSILLFVRVGQYNTCELCWTYTTNRCQCLVINDINYKHFYTCIYIKIFHFKVEPKLHLTSRLNARCSPIAFESINKQTNKQNMCKYVCYWLSFTVTISVTTSCSLYNY